jgi:hypothetical protein
MPQKLTAEVQRTAEKTCSKATIQTLKIKAATKNMARHIAELQCTVKPQKRASKRRQTIAPAVRPGFFTAGASRLPALRFSVFPFVFFVAASVIQCLNRRQQG